ncbi:ATP-binding protein [Candidatus Chlorohelix sp.]|uniref:sensor histidine kinase n=1 Tax=Candidatus Chlorohelix sp. TaxID=3139201 RepID=UPI0030643D5A
MTLWYGGVLAIALLFFGLALYFTAQQNLLQPILAEMKAQTALLEQQWLRQPQQICPLVSTTNNPIKPLLEPPPGESRFRAPFYFACYDNTGILLSLNSRATGTELLSNPDIYLSSSLALKALSEWKQNGQREVTDTVDGGQSIGQIYRYAKVVTDISGQKVLGVVQVGRTVEDLQSALQVWRDLLLVLGFITLLVATAGGLFLAGRALQPTRQAFTRQQVFIADASHELRTPLTLLKADAELLLRGSETLDPDDAELVMDIMTEAEHLNNIANNLLQLARLDAGKQHLEQDVVDLSEIGSGVVKRVKAFATEKRLELKVNVSAPVLVIGDKQLLEQAILILLDNAVKYTPEGGAITLRTGSDAKWAWLEVVDTGIGIPPEHLAHLGERFYRVDKARSREEGGTGLGLALAKSIAGLHKGRLQIESEPNGGTIAKIILAVVRERS